MNNQSQSRKSLLVLAGVAWLSVMSPATVVGQEENPRLILQITVDQLRGDLPVDLAPPLSATVGAKPPSGTRGKVLIEVMEGR